MISTRLRNETASHHEAIENARRFSRLGSPDFNQDEYIEILERFYGFYAPLEQTLQTQHPALLNDLAYQRRFKLPLLTADLQFWGHSEQQIHHLPQCPYIPDLSSQARALGCIYVMEGSTHGAQFITKRLQQQLQLTDNGLSFYRGYGAETMPQWLAFKTYLDASAEKGTPEDAADMVQAAEETFQALHRWMDESNE